jgi:hypothetical protein
MATLRQKHRSTYECWVNMKTRCGNPNSASFARYGGRGIQVCNRWQDFDNFFADMGARPDGLTLERRDNDGAYEPKNCYWATRKAQARNRASNIVATVDGTTLHARDWAARLGVSPNAFYTRARRDGCEAAVRHYMTNGVKKFKRKERAVCSERR